MHSTHGVAHAALLGLFFVLARSDSISSCPTAENTYTSAKGAVYAVCPNTDYQGPTINAVQNIADTTACTQLCGQNAACQNAVFQKNGNVCHLKGARNDLNWAANNGFDSARLLSINGCPSGEVKWTSASNGQIFMVCPGTDYQGYTVQMVQNVADITACTSLCSQSAGCQNAVFQRNGNVCHLKGPRDAIVWSTNAAFDSARLVTQTTCLTGETQIVGDAGQVMMICPNSDYQGASTQVVGGYTSIAQCAQLCMRTAGCQNSVYQPNGNLCHLKAARQNLNWAPDARFDSARVVANAAMAAGYRLVGSSGATAQMVFLPPNTTKAVFLDNYHYNAGGPAYNLFSNSHGQTYVYAGTTTAVFGTEFDWRTTKIRALRPQSNTFCSAGAFWPDGTMMNMAGAEPDNNGVADGFQQVRTFAPGPCANDVCTADWVEGKRQLKARRWYPTAQTLTDGGVVVVGGSNAGGLVTNLAEINVPTYEKLYADNRATSKPISLPILQFDSSDNRNPRKSYNLYPALHLLPNSQGRSLIFQVAATMAEIWDYTSDRQYRSLPGTPRNQPRTFPSGSTFVLLPIRLNDQVGEVLLCGGSSADIPDPVALNDCWRIRPLDTGATWKADDNLPNGAQTMSDGILLPDGTVLILNGAHKGSGGGLMADDPAFTPLLYNPLAAQGARFTPLQASTIPRLYHSVAHLLPSGEVLVAGSNPIVGYTPTGYGNGNAGFWNYNGQSYLRQQQFNAYPTEYRVEIFSPPYMKATSRPILSLVDSAVRPAATFRARLNFNGTPTNGKIVAFLSNPGFTTHGVTMGQRMVELQVTNSNGALTLRAPPNYSYAPPGFYLLFVSVNGIPGEGRWVQIR